MTKLAFVSLVLLALAGCKSTQTKPMTGSEMVQERDGRSTFVTYVTPEEYDHMACLPAS